MARWRVTLRGMYDGVDIAFVYEIPVLACPHPTDAMAAAKTAAEKMLMIVAGVAMKIEMVYQG